MAQSEEKKTVPPYLAYKTFKNFLEGLRANGVPMRVDRSVMSSLSGAAQSSLMLTMKYFGLVSANGLPDDRLHQLVKSQGGERQKILAELLRQGYPFLFSGGFDLKSATPKHFEDQFANTGATGDTTKKCISFFLAAAKDAGIPISTYLQKYRSTGGTRPRRIVPPPARNNRQDIHPPGDPVHEGPPPTWAQMLLSKFPELDPAWPDDVKAKWFDSFKELMSMRRAEGEEQ